MWQALFAMGYKGGYGCVCTVARAWKIAEGLVALGAAFIPLKYRHCEDFQFDWSTEYIFDTLELITTVRLNGGRRARDQAPERFAGGFCLVPT